ncbi:MAG: thrombospondin type 3 repeat-containing protein [Kiritimatiellia bacterium]
MKPLFPCLLAAALAAPAGAQLAPRLDCTASSGIFGPAVDLPLPGGNPAAQLFGLASVPGALLHLLSAGPNGQPDPPRADGGPGGDDVLVAELHIGEGMPPGQNGTGMFSASVARPAGQARVFLRAFNAATLAAATHCGQSALFTPSGVEVMDVSRLGLLATTLPLGVDWSTSDSDGDGVSDLDEWKANTNPSNAADLFRAFFKERDELQGVVVEARPGRTYTLQRSTGDLGGVMRWESIWSSGPVATAQSLTLPDVDAFAVPASRIYYRVLVESP